MKHVIKIAISSVSVLLSTQAKIVTRIAVFAFKNVNITTGAPTTGANCMVFRAVTQVYELLHFQSINQSSLFQTETSIEHSKIIKAIKAIKVVKKEKQK